MTLYDFLLLSPEEQATVTWKYGSFIAVGDSNACKVLLYQLDNFYVEVYYNCELGKIEEFRSFDNIDLLEPYLASIDLSELVPVVRPKMAQPAPAPGFGTRVWQTLHRLFA